MEAILTRIAVWAPRRTVYQLYIANCSIHQEGDTDKHIGTFTTLEKAVEYGKNEYANEELFANTSYLDGEYTLKTVWHWYNNLDHYYE